MISKPVVDCILDRLGYSDPSLDRGGIVRYGSWPHIIGIEFYKECIAPDYVWALLLHQGVLGDEIKTAFSDCLPA